MRPNNVIKHFLKLYPKPYTLNPTRGFTLVEIIVVIAIVAVLATGLIVGINPRAQQDKARDATRFSDISEIRKSLNLYYSDKNCYPGMTSVFQTALENGSQWKEGETVYMQKVPKDPAGLEYVYVTDDSVCPQWSVVFAKLSQLTTVTTACPLATQSNCVPPGFDNTWTCVASGNTNCAALLTSTLGDVLISSPTATPTLSSTPTPTPTLPASDQEFFVAQPPGTSPEFYQGTISPLYQAVGQSQKVMVDVAGATADVASVSITVKSDTKTQTYPATMTAGTVVDGTWTAAWTVNDTTIKRYVVTLNGTDTAGNLSTFDISIK
jgi:type II secretion system protein G